MIIAFHWPAKRAANFGGDQFKVAEVLFLCQSLGLAGWLKKRKALRANHLEDLLEIGAAQMVLSDGDSLAFLVAPLNWSLWDHFRDTQFSFFRKVASSSVKFSLHFCLRGTFP